MLGTPRCRRGRIARALARPRTGRAARRTLSGTPDAAPRRSRRSAETRSRRTPRPRAVPPRRSFAGRSRGQSDRPARAHAPFDAREEPVPDEGVRNGERHERDERRWHGRVRGLAERGTDDYSAPAERDHAAERAEPFG